jgi:hypothetical protein
MAGCGQSFKIYVLNQGVYQSIISKGRKGLFVMNVSPGNHFLESWLKLAFGMAIGFPCVLPLNCRCVHPFHITVG